MTSPHTDGGESDGGLQFERTALAYWRTALAAGVAGLLIVRQTSGGVERAVGTVGAVAGVAVIVGIGFARQRALARRSGRIRHRLTAGIVAALLLLQAIAVVVVV